MRERRRRKNPMKILEKRNALICCARSSLMVFNVVECSKYSPPKSKTRKKRQRHLRALYSVLLMHITTDGNQWKWHCDKSQKPKIAHTRRIAGCYEIMYVSKYERIIHRKFVLKHKTIGCFHRQKRNLRAWCDAIAFPLFRSILIIQQAAI